MSLFWWMLDARLNRDANTKESGKVESMKQQRGLATGRLVRLGF